jgi:DNA repair protein RecN (Recombination protein N)
VLTELNIRNFAIIDELRVAFDGGLNVISGETGAGKSIIIGAVSLLLGDRANADMIRSFEDAAVVEALFDVRGRDGLRDRICEMGFGDGDELVVRRVVSRSGKNRVYINGQLASLASLAAIGESLINICGQHEHQMILNPETHLDILDEFGGLMPLRTAYRENYNRCRSLQERLAGLQERQARRTEREELLRYQVEEIAAADPKPGEDVALADEKKILANVRKLTDLAGAAHETLYGKGGAVLSELRGVVAAVKEIRKIDPALKLTDQELEEIYFRIEEAAFTLRDYAKHLSFDPGRLEVLEERLEALGRLKRKYGGTLDAVLARRTEAQKELGEISSLEEEIGARALSEKRQAAAASLKRSVEAEIRTLGMEGARFEALFRNAGGDRGETVLNEKGMDTPEFYLTTNPGEEMKPLRGIASGGELSRIMLALKKVLARTGSVGTIVFDEVDSGIGGATAHIVGRKLREVAQHHQVLCITHLPQIACCGDRHYRVVKGLAGERTNTSVSLLSDEERLEEITRMLGGTEPTGKAGEHAREMLFAARG